ncbi:MAG: META domain-containing protein [bacterium]|nr:META domain-containing protein [bacterium]
MRIQLFLFLLIVLLSFTCSTKETEKIDVMRLHDIWALESIEGKKVIIDETVRILPVLEIYVEDERVHGNTGCNVLNGSVEIDEEKILFSKIITTEMACPGNLEQRFLASLIEVNRYKIEKMSLHLFEDEKELMVFKKID